MDIMLYVLLLGVVIILVGIYYVSYEYKKLRRLLLELDNEKIVFAKKESDLLIQKNRYEKLDNEIQNEQKRLIKLNKALEKKKSDFIIYD